MKFPEEEGPEHGFCLRTQDHMLEKMPINVLSREELFWKASWQQGVILKHVWNHCSPNFTAEDLLKGNHKTHKQRCISTLILTVKPQKVTRKDSDVGIVKEITMGIND